MEALVASIAVLGDLQIVPCKPNRAALQQDRRFITRAFLEYRRFFS